MIQNQALASIEPTFTAEIPPQFEREKKTSNIKETFKDLLFKNDSLETSTADGLFKCPECDVFTSEDVDDFRQHLLNKFKARM